MTIDLFPDTLVGALGTFPLGALTGAPEAAGEPPGADAPVNPWDCAEDSAADSAPASLKPIPKVWLPDPVLLVLLASPVPAAEPVDVDRLLDEMASGAPLRYFSGSTSLPLIRTSKCR
jgi:hypothetical protein